MHEEWSAGDLDAIAAMLAASPRPAPPGQAQRVLVHASGFRQSPYADIKPADTKLADTKPAGGDRQGAPSKLWHSSPGSSGW